MKYSGDQDHDLQKTMQKQTKSMKAMIELQLKSLIVKLEIMIYVKKNLKDMHIIY